MSKNPSIPVILPAGNVEVTKYQDMWAVDDTILNGISAFLSKEDFVSWFLQIFTSTSGAVTSVMTYPFSLDSISGDPRVIEIAGVPVNEPGTVNELRAPHLNKTVATPVKFGINVPTPTNQNFLDYEPFTIYQMYIPFIGNIDLNARNILGKSLTLEYAVDFHTGGCTVYLYNNTETLYTTSFQIGASIPFGSTNEGDAIAARALGAIKTGLTLGFGASAAAGSAITSSYKTTYDSGVVRSAQTSTISTATKTQSTQVTSIYGPNGKNSSQITERSQEIKQRGLPPETPTVVNGILNMASDKVSYIAGAPGGDFSQFTCPSTPYLIITRTHIHDIEDYAKYFGYACAEKIKLGDHHGYCELSNIHMEGLPDTMEDEIEAIENLLKSGVILP